MNKDVYIIDNIVKVPSIDLYILRHSIMPILCVTTELPNPGQNPPGQNSSDNTVWQNPQDEILPDVDVQVDFFSEVSK